MKQSSGSAVVEWVLAASLLVTAVHLQVRLLRELHEEWDALLKKRLIFEGELPFERGEAR